MKNDNDFIEIVFRYDTKNNLKILYDKKEYTYFDVFISCKKQKKIPSKLFDLVSIDSFYISNKDYSYDIKIGIFKKDFSLYYILIKNNNKTIKYTSLSNDNSPIQITLRKLLKI